MRYDDDDDDDDSDVKLRCLWWRVILMMILSWLLRYDYMIYIYDLI
jgi:hypothetical protein